MKIKHWIAVTLGIVVFAVVVLYPTPTADDQDLEDQITEMIRVTFEMQPDAVTVKVDDETVRLDGLVESETQIAEILEAIRPMIQERTLVPNLNFNSSSKDE